MTTSRDGSTRCYPFYDLYRLPSLRLTFVMNMMSVCLQTNGTFSQEYAGWLAQHPADRIFDDIVSSLRFAQQQYDSKALSIAGIGCGGGWALKVILIALLCAIYDNHFYARANIWIMGIEILSNGRHKCDLT